jgi:hypothetical protein
MAAGAGLLESPVEAELIRCVRDAYLDQPTLNLTVAQARRLFGLDRETTEAVLDTLVHDRFLTRTSEALFVRAR